MKDDGGNNLASINLRTMSVLTKSFIFYDFVSKFTENGIFLGFKEEKM